MMGFEGAPYEQGVEAFATTWDAEVMQGCLCDSSWPVGIGPGERQQPEWFGPDCSLRRCPTGDDPFTHGVDETDCSNQTLPSGVVTKNGNKCHVDCSNRGLCDHALGVCKCFDGCDRIFLTHSRHALALQLTPPRLHPSLRSGTTAITAGR